MPEATHTHNTGCAVAPSRRQLGGSLLAAACGAAFAGAVVLPDRGDAFPAGGARISQPPLLPNPDAELLAACAAFDTLERAYQATDFNCEPCSSADKASDAERARICNAQMPLINRMVELQAATHAGQVARARSLILWKPELLEDGPGDFGECLASAIVRDLVGAA